MGFIIAAVLAAATGMLFLAKRHLHKYRVTVIAQLAIIALAVLAVPETATVLDRLQLRENFYFLLAMAAEGAIWLSAVLFLATRD